MTGLKPCPLCGGEAIFETTQNKLPLYQIYCENCAVELTRLDKDELTSTWNDRTAQMTGICSRVERNGKWLSLDLAEMTKAEIEKCLEAFDKPALIRTIVAILGVE